MAILNIFDENAEVEVTVAGQTAVQNHQQKFVFSDILIKQISPTYLTQNILLKGTGKVHSITPPLLVNSSTKLTATQVYTDTNYIHSNFPTPTTYVSSSKDMQSNPTLTIKIRGSYVSDNTAGTGTSGGTGPYWS